MISYKVSSDFKEKLNADLGKRHLADGYMLGGKLSGEKLALYPVDRYGKHSDFMLECFYGKLSGDKVTGRFRIGTYALVLLIILAAVAVETAVSAVIFADYLRAVFPTAIVAIEVIYLFWLKRASLNTNRAIEKYLGSFDNENQPAD